MARQKLKKIDGRVPKNPSEVKCYDYLKEFIPRDMRVVYEEEDLEYTITSKYKPDYRISYKKDDGTVCFLEYKGNGRAFDNSVRQKMIAVKEQYPQYQFYIVFHSDGKIGPKRKDGSFMRQSDWSKKHGFDFCIGINNIKEEWFK